MTGEMRLDIATVLARLLVRCVYNFGLEISLLAIIPTDQAVRSNLLPTGIVSRYQPVVVCRSCFQRDTERRGINVAPYHVMH